MGFWLAAFLWIGTTFLSGLLRKRPRVTAPQPSALGDFQLPTAEEGRPVPVVFGTVRLSGPNVLWYGDLLVAPIREEDQVTGYRYFMGIHYGLCHGPVDAIVDVRWDDKAPGFTTTDAGTYWTLNFDAAGLFGGDDREGGVQGAMDVYKGGTAQASSPYLEARIGASLPAYRGMCHAVLRQMYLGNSAYLKDVSFTVRRLPNTLGLTAGAHDISGDANPAAALYEILTDQRWGLGVSSGLIDTAGFLAAGATLKAESLGISMVFDQAATAADLVEEILRHVDGVLYMDPATGLLTLKLARADYVVASLPAFDTSNVKDCAIARGSWEETRNHVRVRYVDRAANFAERIAQAQDRANIEVRGGQVDVEDLDFRGISNAAAAQRVAARELKSVAYPLRKLELTVNRDGWALRPGDVFRLTWPPAGIVDLPCRVTRPQEGELAEGTIRLDAVEDVFAVAWTGYPDPIAPGWTAPVTAPQVLAAQRLLEAPYPLNMGGPSSNRSVLTLGVQGVGFAQGYRVWEDIGGGNYFQRTTCRALTPSGRLTAALSHVATSFTIQDPVAATLLKTCTAAELAAGRNLLLVDDELIAWQTVTDNGNGTFTISGCVRGVADTTPASHLSLGRVWFVTDGSGWGTLGPFGTDLTLTEKLLTFNSNGQLSLGSTSPLSITTTSRAARPYVPTAVQLNTQSYPATITGELTVSWSHRNRLGSWSYANAGATGGPEASTTYRVKVYGESGTLVHTETGLTGTSWTYLQATEIAESGLGRLNNQVRVVVEALVGSTVSHQAYDYTVPRV